MYLRVEELDESIQRTTNSNFKENIKRIKFMHRFGYSVVMDNTPNY
ncbi:hypothetical protein [Chryseobacterium sp. HSC-36S06]|nr:hypothetical protein [Chryseobacterium sp. HSC-36S06]MCP2037664.1 hypothetical protein [Chryseobacterium sp. HSC-36S06]